MPRSEQNRTWAAALERRWAGYVVSLLLIGLVSVAGYYLVERMARTNLAMLFLLTVMICALRLGRGPALASAVAGSIIFAVWFVPPVLKLPPNDTWYAITFVTLLVVGLVISTLASQARDEARNARNREQETAALYSLSRSLAEVSSLEQILEAIARHLVETFHQPLVVMLPGSEGLEVRFCSPGFELDEAERARAAAVFQDGQSADGPACFLPLKTWRGVLGVLGIKGGDMSAAHPAGRRQLLEGLVSQAASALERALLAEEARQGQLLQEANKLQKALLNSISHNLRTPLATVTGALTTLLEDQAVLDAATERDLLETAQGEAERLNRVVGNLLDMTRLEAGTVGLRREPADVQDLVGTAIEHLGGMARDRQIRVEIEPNLPLVEVDSVLIAQALVNLLDNALKYSPADQPVDVRACAAGDQVEIAVEDRGIGIASADLERVFERFYRAPRTGTVNGMGLGLSISKRFVEAHGGSIRAASDGHAGTVMTFTLPQAVAGQEVKDERRTAGSRG